MSRLKQKSRNPRSGSDAKKSKVEDSNVRLLSDPNRFKTPSEWLNYYMNDPNMPENQLTIPISDLRLDRVNQNNPLPEMYTLSRNIRDAETGNDALALRTWKSELLTTMNDLPHKPESKKTFDENDARKMRRCLLNYMPLKWISEERLGSAISILQHETKIFDLSQYPIMHPNEGTIQQIAFVNGFFPTAHVDEVTDFRVNSFSLIPHKRNFNELSSWLDEKKNKGITVYVQGCPGIGKTTTVWAWCQYRARNCNDTVWFVRINRDSDVNFCCLRAQEVIAFKDPIEGKLKLDNLTSQYLFSSIGVRPTIVVVDGATQENRKLLSKWIPTYAFAITVSSVGLDLMSEGENQYPTFQAYSWTLEDFKMYADSKHPDLWKTLTNEKKLLIGSNDDVQIDDETMRRLIESKHYYAGGSARWMFEEKVGGIKNLVEYFLTRVKHPSDLFQLQDLPYRSPQFVNHLMALYESSTNGTQGPPIASFVSRFVCQYIASRKHDREFLKEWLPDAESYAVDINNQSLQGWLFEMKISMMIHYLRKEKSKLRLEHYASRLVEEFGCTNVETFYTEDEIKFSGGNLREYGCWFIPYRWNQECYDFFFVRIVNDEVHVFTLQATCSDTHSLKFGAIKRLILRLKSLFDVGTVIKVFHIAVVPMGGGIDFKWEVTTKTVDSAWLSQQRVTFEYSNDHILLFSSDMSIDKTVKKRGKKRCDFATATKDDFLNLKIPHVGEATVEYWIANRGNVKSLDDLKQLTEQKRQLHSVKIDWKQVAPMFMIFTSNSQQ